MKKTEESIPKDQIYFTLSYILDFFYKQIRDIEFILNLKNEIKDQINNEKKAINNKNEIENKFKKIESINQTLNNLYDQIDDIKAENSKLKRRNQVKEINENDDKINANQKQIKNLIKEKEEIMLNLYSFGIKYYPELKLKYQNLIDLNQYLES